MADSESQLPISLLTDKLRQPAVDVRGVPARAETAAQVMNTRATLDSRPTTADRGFAGKLHILDKFLLSPPRAYDLSLPAASRTDSRLGGKSAGLSLRKHGDTAWPPPKIVKQITDVSCWAAALESWLVAVNGPSQRRTQSQLLKQIDARDNGFDVENFRAWAASLGMESAYLGLTQFQIEHIRDLLKYSVLFVSYCLSRNSRWWHDVVLYDTTQDDLKSPVYLVMNPSLRYPEQSGRQMWPAGYQRWEKRHFFPAGNDVDVLIGWRVKGRAGRVR
jgi:hypothetical protein